MSRNQELNQKMRDERRELILATALRIFVAKGIVGTKMREIAAESGMSLGLAYHYFVSKEEIYTELIREAYDKMNHSILEMERMSVSPRKKIRMAIDRMLEDLNVSSKFGWYCLLIAQAGVSLDIPEEAGRVIESERDIAYQAMERIIREGQRDGSVKHFDARDMALFFWTAINGLAIRKAIEGESFRMPDVSILARMFM